MWCVSVSCMECVLKTIELSLAMTKKSLGKPVQGIAQGTQISQESSGPSTSQCSWKCHFKPPAGPACSWICDPEGTGGRSAHTGPPGGTKSPSIS